LMWFSFNRSFVYALTTKLPFFSFSLLFCFALIGSNCYQGTSKPSWFGQTLGSLQVPRSCCLNSLLESCWGGTVVGLDIRNLDPLLLNLISLGVKCIQASKVNCEYRTIHRIFFVDAFVQFGIFRSNWLRTGYLPCIPVLLERHTDWSLDHHGWYSCYARLYNIDWWK
jgi:hypothetical protein